MSRDNHFQDYWSTDPSFKLWVRKSDDWTNFSFYRQKKIDVTTVEIGHLNVMQDWLVLKIKIKCKS